MNSENRSDQSHKTASQVNAWYQDLKRQLTALGPYLVPGQIVTFQQISPEEKGFFETLTHTVRLPPSACTVFIPPSVVQQAMWPGGNRSSAVTPDGLYQIAPDAGALAACRCGDLATIVNALFAFPPLTPGIDVYENGNLLAGYTYRGHPELTAALADVLDTYLA